MMISTRYLFLIILGSLVLLNLWLNLNYQPACAPSRKLLLLNFVTVAEKFDRRALLRNFYSKTTPYAFVDVKYVIGKPNNTTPELLFKLQMEQAAHGDLTILDSVENMDDGKTWDMISRSIADSKVTGQTYDFVVKGDDDSFIHLPNLVERVLTLPKKSTYFGRFYAGWFMTGMMYLLSWDLVHEISLHPNLPKVGHEDQKVAEWMDELHIGEHRISEETEMYDHPESGGGWAHPYTPKTITIHLAKSDALMTSAMQHFYDSMQKFEKPELSACQKKQRRQWMK